MLIYVGTQTPEQVLSEGYKLGEQVPGQLDVLDSAMFLFCRQNQVHTSFRRHMTPSLFCTCPGQNSSNLNRPQFSGQAGTDLEAEKITLELIFY